MNSLQTCRENCSDLMRFELLAIGLTTALGCVEKQMHCRWAVPLLSQCPFSHSVTVASGASLILISYGTASPMELPFLQVSLQRELARAAYSISISIAAQFIVAFCGSVTAFCAYSDFTWNLLSMWRLARLTWSDSSWMTSTFLVGKSSSSVINILKCYIGYYYYHIGYYQDLCDKRDSN